VPTILCSNSVSTLAALLEFQPTVPQFRAVFWCSSLKSQPGAVQQHAEVQGRVALECSPAFIAVEVERLLGCVAGRVPVPLSKEQNTKYRRLFVFKMRHGNESFVWLRRWKSFRATPKSKTQSIKGFFCLHREMQ